MVERNGMVESRDVHPHENDVACKGSSDDCNESQGEGSRRDVNGNVNVTSGVLTQSSNLVLSRRRCCLSFFIQEEHWTTPAERTSRILILIGAMRVRSVLMTRFNSSTHFICNMLD